MKIVIDRYIPFLKGVLEPYAEVVYLDPEQITASAVRNADALLVRTRTKCNASLLEGSSVRFVATATIGYDHIDTEYCRRNDIFWTNSPGCNAQGVCDYVQEALTLVVPDIKKMSAGQTDDAAKTIGIVGVGHVGSLVARMAEKMGLRVLLNDPPKGIGVPLAQIAHEADIITFHTPLTRNGEYPSWHLCDRAFLRLCKPEVVIVNAARGGVVDEEAALLEENDGKTFIIDTWEGEPDINMRMLERAKLASYHIAGYTLQGKINASNMCLEALCNFFSLPMLHIPQSVLPVPETTKSGWLLDVDRQFRQHPSDFETLRETYRLR